MRVRNTTSALSLRGLWHLKNKKQTEQMFKDDSLEGSFNTSVVSKLEINIGELYLKCFCPYIQSVFHSLCQSYVREYKGIHNIFYNFLMKFFFS